MIYLLYLYSLYSEPVQTLNFTRDAIAEVSNVEPFRCGYVQNCVIADEESACTQIGTECADWIKK